MLRRPAGWRGIKPARRSCYATSHTGMNIALTGWFHRTIRGLVLARTYTGGVSAAVSRGMRPSASSGGSGPGSMPSGCSGGVK